MSYKNAVNLEPQDLMTIFVETLTGTTFEIKVSPQDRVKSIKSKIQRVEGIPVSHQHLLYKSRELEDSSCVTEPGVALHDQATIRLVLSMRGGPISLVHQAMPLNKAMLKHFVKLNREQLLEDMPQGCRMAILVLRVGDQLNLLHVVEDVDDSADSFFEGKDDFPLDSLLEGESSKSLEENSKTLEKVCDLKEKMEKLSLQRKSMKGGGTREESSSRTLSSNTLKPIKPKSSTKLPSLSHQTLGYMVKSRSEFSQVPILPDIASQTLKRTTRELELNLKEDEDSTQLVDSLRPKTCPSSMPENRLYNLFTEEPCQNSLVPQSHFRSCVSACSSKMDREWGEEKSVFPSLNVLPPIAAEVPDFLNNQHKLTTSEPRNLLASTVPTLEKINLKRNTSSTFRFKENPIREPQSSLGRRKSAFLSRSVDHSEKNRLDASSSSTSSTRTFSSFELFPKVSNVANSLTTFTESPCQVISINTRDDLAEAVIECKKTNLDKKTRIRCAECKKRLSVTNTFECRCGFPFCSYHRYSETHHCTYDFKKESRKMLEQANPTVVAPKLPKI